MNAGRRMLECDYHSRYYVALRERARWKNGVLNAVILVGSSGAFLGMAQAINPVASQVTALLIAIIGAVLAVFRYQGQAVEYDYQAKLWSRLKSRYENLHALEPDVAWDDPRMQAAHWEFDYLYQTDPLAMDQKLAERLYAEVCRSHGVDPGA